MGTVVGGKVGFGAGVVALVALAWTTGAGAAAVGTGPVGEDNGQRHDCTGTQAGIAVLCVRAGAAGGGTGTAAAPFASIQSAITAAKSGDVIQVAAGLYDENPAVGSYNAPVSKAVTLLGGFSSDFSQRNADSNRSIIDGGGRNPVVQLHVSATATSTVDGFELRNGRGLGQTYEDGYGHGGGVYAVNYGDGAIVISHNRIHSNRTNRHDEIDSRGGGIHAAVASYATHLGTMRIEDNRIFDNEAGKGAGINVVGRHASVLRNLVQDNVGHHDHGGGVYISTGITEVRHNIVVGNEIGATVAYGWGGGIIVASANADLEGNLIADNYTPTAGSGVFWDEGATGSMKNDLVVRNRCPDGGRSAAAIYIDGGPGGPSHVVAENLTVADHVCPATPDGGAVYLEGNSSFQLKNSIFWNNTRDLALATATYAFTYSITTVAGSGNFVADPRFADPAALDYHLRSEGGRFTPGGWVTDAVTSPAIDAGEPASTFANETAPNGGRINLGAYGNTTEASRSEAGNGDAVFGDGFED